MRRARGKWRSRRPKGLPVIALAAAALWLAATPVTACEGDEVLFESAQTPDGAAPEPVALPRGTVWIILLEPDLVENADICATVEFVDGESIAAGLAFWAEDAAHFFMLTAAMNGNVYIYRRRGDDWTKISHQDGNPAVNRDLGAENRLRVTLDGSLAILYVNGMEVYRFRGQPPADKSKIGFFVYDNSATYTGGAARLTHLRATTVPK